MRLTYILAVSVVATLHASATAFPSAQDANVAIENGVVPAIVDPTPVEGGRMLRRVDNDYDDLDDDDLDDDDLADDDLEEERGLGDVVKKLNPVKAVKNSAKKAAEHSAKVKEALKDAADYQRMIEKAKEAVYKK